MIRHETAKNPAFMAKGVQAKLPTSLQMQFSKPATQDAADSRGTTGFSARTRAINL